MDKALWIPEIPHRPDLTIEELIKWADSQPEAVLCKRCGRELTDDTSKQAGIGPICVHKIGEE